MSLFRKKTVHSILKQVEKNDLLTKQVQIQDPTTVQIIDSAYNFGKVAEGEVVEYNYRFNSSEYLLFKFTTSFNLFYINIILFYLIFHMIFKSLREIEKRKKKDKIIK